MIGRVIGATPCSRSDAARSRRVRSRCMDRVRDNTVTTNAQSTKSKSSSRADRMCVSAAFGRIWQSARKVEGLVVRLDRGSSNLPGRISHSAGLSEAISCRTETAAWRAMPRKEPVVRVVFALQSTDRRTRCQHADLQGLFAVGTRMGTPCARSRVVRQGDQRQHAAPPFRLTHALADNALTTSSCHDAPGSRRGPEPSRSWASSSARAAFAMRVWRNG